MSVDGLAEEFIEILFEANPLWPSLLGLPGDHDRLPDPSAEAEQRTRAAYLDLVARAESTVLTARGSGESNTVPTACRSGEFNTDRGGQDAVTRDVVIQQAKAAVDTIDSRLGEFAVSDAFTAPVQLVLLILPHVKLNDEAKTKGYLARLAAIPSYVDKVIERQRTGLADGLVPPGFLVDAAVAFFEHYLADPDGDPLRIDAEIDGFAGERDRLLAEAVRPAVTRYRDFLVGEVKPLALGSEKPGLCWQPGGDERYAALIRAHTTTERTAQDLHDTGLEMIEKLAEEYRELGSRVFGTSDLGEIFERLRTDPELRWSGPEELLDSARSAIRNAESVAPQWFQTVPEQRCEVSAVPEAEAEGGTIAYYVHPALDGSRPGTYYANTFQAQERFRHTSEAVAFHEAVPGHHFQICLALGLTDLPLLRRIADVNAYSEGWGLYAERLADEMGLYSSDVTRFGMLTQDSMRAGRLVVDTGMHALGWSRQRAVDYLRASTPMAPLEIELEIDRYAGCPAQALSYMVGRLEIQRIRAEAERALGERFDIRAFHDVVLGNGILPLPILDAVVTGWVARQA